MPANFLSEVGVRFIVDDISGLRAGMSTVRRQAALTANSMVSMNQKIGDAGALRRFQDGMRQVGSTINILGNQLTNLGFRLGAFVSAPIIGLGTAVAKTGAEFEDEMVKIETLVGVNAARVREWRDEILEIGPALGALPTDLAQSLFFITSAGIRDTTQAMGALEDAAKLSAIGMGDMVDIGNALTSVMFTFGISSEEAGDQLLTTVREGKVEADTLAASMGRVIPIAEQLGVSFAETGANIATFTRTGVPAEVAVTALRSVLTSIQKPTAKARETLEAYGSSIEEIRESIAERGLASTLIQLVDSFGENNQAIAEVFGNIRGLSDVLAVTGDQAQSYREILDSITNSSGNMADAFERVSETASFQFAKTRSALNVVAQELAVIILPLVNDALDKITDLAAGLREFARANAEVIEFVAPFLALAAIVPILTFTFGVFISTIGGAIIILSNIIAAFITMSPLVIGLTTAVLALAGAFGGLAAIFAANVRGIAREMNVDFDQLARNAAVWGANVVISFANGMLAAIVHVLNALTQIARAVTVRLQAQSPPRILPDLTKWGTAAMQAWLDGWALADFSVFDDIADSVSGFLRAIGSAQGLEGTQIAEGILGVRHIIASAVEQFRTLGEVSEATMDFLAENIGQNSEEVLNYVNALFDLERANRRVQDAQENLNEVQEHYDGILGNLNATLERIRGQKEENARQDRRSELERLLVDPRATEEVRERARLELQELETLDRIADVETRRDAEVTRAERQLELAQEERDVLEEQAEIQRNILEFLTEQFNLMGQTVDKVKEISDAAAGAGAAAGAAAEIEPIEGAGLEFVDEEPLAGAESGAVPGDLIGPQGVPLQGGLPSGESSPLSLFVGLVERGISDMVAELEGAATEFQKAFAELFETALDPEDPKVNQAIKLFAGHMAGELVQALGREIRLAIVGEDLIGSIAGLLTFEGFEWPSLEGTGGFAEGFMMALTGYPTIPAAMQALIIDPMNEMPLDERINEAMSGFFDGVGEVVRPIIEGFVKDWLEILGSVPGEVVTVFTTGFGINSSADGTVLGTFAKLVARVIELAWELFDELVGESIFVDLVDEIKSLFDGVSDIVETLDGIFFGPDSVVSKANDLFDALVGPNGVIHDIAGNIVGAFAGIGGAIVDAIGSLSEAGSELLTSFYNLGTDLVGQIDAAIEDFDWVENIRSELQAAASSVRTWIENFFRNIILGIFFNQPNDDPDQPDPEFAGPDRTSNFPGGNGFSLNSLFNTGASVAAAPVVVSTGTTVMINMGGVTVSNRGDIDRLATAIEQRLMRRLR